MSFLKYLFLFLFIVNGFPSVSKDFSRYNVVWYSPSKDASGTMPIGNGDMAANVYAVENGELYLLLSKNDAYNYCGDLFKTGRVKISLNPNPFKGYKNFVQELDINTGAINIKSDDTEISIWIDANRPVCHVSVNSSRVLDVSVEHDLWTRFDHCVYNTFKNKDEKSDDIDYGATTQDTVVDIHDGLMWFFNVGDKSVYENDLKYYNVECLSDEYEDPFRYNVFGNYVKSDELSLKNGKLTGKSKNIDIRIYSLTMKTKDVSKWIDEIKSISNSHDSYKHSWKQHCKWWNDFWNRSWIMSSDSKLPENEREVLYGEHSNGKRQEKDIAALISQNYQMFRYFMATQGRGAVPVKFNGGLFTQQLLLSFEDKTKRSGDKDTLRYGLLSHPDDRLWGRRFTFQNQRHLYWPLLGSGDTDLIRPFFNYYFNLLPHRKAVTKEWFGHDGAYLRENIEPTGMERDCGNIGKPLKAEPGTMAGHYHDMYFTSTLELLAMMINYAEYTKDCCFVEKQLLPYAREAIRFYINHYKKDEKGKLVLDPAMVLETFWKAKNPTPDISGLTYCAKNLLRLKYGNDNDCKLWNNIIKILPKIPLSTYDGKQFILPAEEYEYKKNAENGELYPVFPFNLYGKAYGNEDIAINTMDRRTVKDAFGCACWTQDQIDWAYCGDTIKVVEGLEKRFKLSSTQCRFPLFGRENPDSCPDFDHFGSGSFAFQRMLVQETPNIIYLFPAWPLSWDVDFKIHTSHGVVECKLKDGKIIKLKTSSKTSRKILYIPEGLL